MKDALKSNIIEHFNGIKLMWEWRVKSTGFHNTSLLNEYANNAGFEVVCLPSGSYISGISTSQNIALDNVDRAENMFIQTKIAPEKQELPYSRTVFERKMNL